jgi:hypothetical protein
MFDVAPSHGVDFNRCTNKELFEYAKDAENDEAIIRTALASRKKPETGFARQWVYARSQPCTMARTLFGANGGPSSFTCPASASPTNSCETQSRSALRARSTEALKQATWHASEFKRQERVVQGNQFRRRRK